MNYLAQNIKYLRKKHAWTQQQLADQIEIKRSLIGSYEEGRAHPKLAVLQQLAALAGNSVDELISADLEQQKDGSETPAKEVLKILPIVVDQQNEELIPIVPVKASAGYLNGFSDPEYIGSLPRFSMPIPELSKERTYRVFQIKGDSMLPVAPGSYVFCEFVSAKEEIKDGQPYVLITKNEGLVYKRVFLKEENQLLLKSDNPEYEPYSIPSGDVLEIWKTKGILSFELPKPETFGMSHISTVLKEMKEEIRKLRNLQ